MIDCAPCHDPVALICRIETQYHQRHRGQLPRLVKMAEMVEDLHESDTGVPRGLHAILTRMSAKLAVHMEHDELILFPAIRSGDGPGIAKSLAVIRADHDAHAAQIAAIGRLTRDLTLPDGACTSWGTLYAGLAAFIDDLTEHMRIETDLVLPQVEA